MKNLDEIPLNVRGRLEFLELLLRFRGWVTRSDLTERFGIGDAAATRDIRLYRDFAKDNLSLNQASKKYEVSNCFSPLFQVDSAAAMEMLGNSSISKVLGMSSFEGVLSIPKLVLPDVDILSTITRAICQGYPIKAGYFSVKNGQSEKSLIPHALFENGVRWYVRAYDENEKVRAFRTYVLTRFISADVSDDRPAQLDRKNQDHQWNRVVSLELVPHPNRKNVNSPQTIEHDFNMVDGCLTVQARAAVAGYWLSHWNVDCTEDHSLQGYEYQLWLSNHQALYDVGSREIAPGLSDYDYD